MIDTARRLDAMAEARVKYGIEMDSAFVALLHRAYWDAFDVARLKGIVSAAGESRRTDQEPLSEPLPAVS
jgi:hypothetical protein